MIALGAKKEMNSKHPKGPPPGVKPPSHLPPPPPPAKRTMFSDIKPNPDGCVPVPNADLLQIASELELMAEDFDSGRGLVKPSDHCRLMAKLARAIAIR